jgi:riboflavin kinase/FMN adenylyltransferase
VHFEVHLLDFEGDLYGKEARFSLEFRVRPERRFASVEALKDQIGQDIAFTRTQLAAGNPVPPQNPPNRP